MNVRRATPDDLEVIWEFWEELEMFDPYFMCAPGRHHPNHSQIEAWLRGDRAVAIVEDDGKVVLTDVFDMKTGQTYLTTTSREKFSVAVPLVFKQEHEWTGQGPWGHCGFVPMVELYVGTGLFKDEGMILRWIE